MKKPSERATSCFFSAAFFFIITAVFEVAAFNTADKAAGILVGIMGLAAALMGVREIYMANNAEKHCYHPDSPNTEKIKRAVRRAKAAHDKEMSNRNTLAREIENPGFALQIGNSKASLRMKTIINEMGFSYEEISADFMSGDIFHGRNSTLNISDTYTFYCDSGKNQFMIRNRSITAVYPYIVNRDMYMNGIFMGIMQEFYVCIEVGKNEKYTLSCRDYTDRYIIDAYRKRFHKLDAECFIYDYEFE